MTNSQSAALQLPSPQKPGVAMTKSSDDDRMYPGSPLTTKTDVSSSSDEQPLMTPPQLTSHLGRIVIPSCSSSMDSISTGDLEIIDPPIRNRHRNVRRVSRSTADGDEQTAALIHSLNQLHRLANLDSAEYQQRLLENTLPALQPELATPLNCPSLGESSPKSSSSQLSLLSKPVQTPLVQLSMSIHRLHAAVANITHEVDGHTDEVQELQSQLAMLRRRNRQLETAAKQVHKKNLKLKQQAKVDRKIAQTLQRRVDKYESQLESQGFQLMASRVQQHEIQLQLHKAQQNSGNEEAKEGSPPRDRSESNLSDFLDVVEQDSQSEEDNRSEKSLQANPNEQHRIRTDSFVSISSDLSEAQGSQKAREDLAGRSPTSVASTKSRSIINGIIRFSADPKSHVEEKIDTKPDASSESVDPKETTQENKAPPASPRKDLPPKADSKGKRAKPSTLFSNRFAKFLGPKVIPNYNLKMVPPFNIQYAELPSKASAEDSKHENKDSTTATAPSSDDNGVSPEKSRKPPTAFAVCGLDGFDSKTNMKPTMGAQLIKISGKAVSDQWTLETLHGAIEQASAEGGKSKQVIFTFRNEVWDSEQEEVLDAAIDRVANPPKPAEAAPNGTEETAKGESTPEEKCHQRTKSDEESLHSVGQTAKDHFQRVRTASTDSVGKAMNGIGHFLQHLNP